MANDVICIIGMHRSGTSMVANLLRRHGLSLGPEGSLMGASESNPLGHFEHTGFLEINETLLKHVGGTWDNPPRLQPGWENDPGLGKLTAAAQSLIKEFAACTIWGWKEPRTTILLPFWQKCIPNLRYVICLRNPLDVALSLAKRDGQSTAAAVHLWRYYTSQAIQDTEGSPRILTFYQDFFRQPSREIDRLSEFCGLQKVGDQSPGWEIVMRELRHQNHGTEALINEPKISFQDKMLYLSLRTLHFDERDATGNGNDTQSNVGDSVGSVLRAMSQMQDREKLAELETVLGEKELQLDALRVDLRTKDEQISRLQEQSARLQLFTDTVRQSIAFRLYRTLVKPFRTF